MKTLAFFALSAVASASVLAVQPASDPKITISGTSTQMVTVNSRSQAHNHASAYATAIQNLSSNRGSIDVAGISTQQTTLDNGADVKNHAVNPGDIAVQNVSSNYGRVSIAKGASSSQSTSINGGGLSNTAKGAGGDNCGGVDCEDAARAMQNVSSNVGDVSIKGTSSQDTSMYNSSVSNTADGAGAVAVQSLASNTGKVDIDGKSKQTVSLKHTTVQNLADGAGTTAVQNLASNYQGVHVTSSGDSEQLVGAFGGTITNKANGQGSQAFQNLSSNFGDVVISGKSKQITMVSGTVLNWADGRNSVAVQNLASNDACDPPKFKLPDCPTGYCWGKRL